MNFLSLSFFVSIALLFCASTGDHDKTGRWTYPHRMGACQQSFPPCKEQDIPHYKAVQTKDAPLIDGVLNEAIWGSVTLSSRFVDLIRGTPTHLDTRVAVAWDDAYLYLAYWLEEPDVKATLKNRDAPIYTNNDAEFFIAGSDGYYEFEINAYGTIYEVLFFWEEAF